MQASIPQWWSWALTAGGVAGLWLAGSNRRSGWAVGVAVQLLWVAYGLRTHQYGFLFSAAAYGTVSIRNWRRWQPSTPPSQPAARSRAVRSGRWRR